jgi:hypothetical protein
VFEKYSKADCPLTSLVGPFWWQLPSQKIQTTVRKVQKSIRRKVMFETKKKDGRRAVIKITKKTFCYCFNQLFFFQVLI